MNPRSSLLPRPAGWHRQFALAVLFLLQAAITLSPLIEPSEQGRMRAHAEQRDAQHQYQHDEATCAVCAVRSLHSSPAQGCAAIACERQQTVAALDGPVAPSSSAEPSALPRAPPSAT